MRRLFAAVLAILTFAALSACGGGPTATPEGKEYYGSAARKQAVNGAYDNLAQHVFAALQAGSVLGKSTTYASNISNGAPSKCPPSGVQISTAHTGRVQICGEKGEAALVGTMTEGKMDAIAPSTGIRLDGLEAWKDEDGVVSGGDAATDSTKVKLGAQGTAEDIKTADRDLCAAINLRSTNYFGA